MLLVRRLSRSRLARLQKAHWFRTVRGSMVRGAHLRLRFAKMMAQGGNSMRNQYRVGLVAVAAALVGCTTVYAPKPGEPTARLRLLFSNPNSTNVYNPYALDKCPDQKRIAFEGVKEQSVRVLGMPGRTDPGLMGGSEVQIPAGKPLGVGMSSGGRAGLQDVVCHVALRFDPVARADYEAEFRWVDNGQRCSVALRRLDGGGTRTNRGGASARPANQRMEPTARPVRVSQIRPEFCAAP